MTINTRALHLKQGDGYTLPSSVTTKEFGKVDIYKTASELLVQFTILMEPQGREAEGWQTGLALDASSSMKHWYGRAVEGTMPDQTKKEFLKKGQATEGKFDGKWVVRYQRAAIDEAIGKGILKKSPNIVQPFVRESVSYLVSNIDASGKTSLIYWACEDGAQCEEIGDFTESGIAALTVEGPDRLGFGSGTMLLPPVRYFADRFKNAPRGMYLVVTDGRIDDLDDVKKFTVQLAREFEAGRRKPLKFVLIGVGREIDEKQMIELDNLDTGTDIDIWDHKIASELRSLVEIFAEVVDENQIVAPTATVYDAGGKVAKLFSDGLPAVASFTMPLDSEWFELEVHGRRIRQSIIY